MRAPEFWAADGLVPRLLWPLSLAWGVGAALRAARGAGLHAPAPVLCVGNAVAGGAGKTPVAIDLVRRLAARGRAPHAISRGYGGRHTGPLRVDPARHDARDVGDEALLLAAAGPAWIARDRVAAARAAAHAGAGVIVLDDGLQDPALAKTLSLLVVDGAYGFGNGRLIPAGPLREPAWRALARADAVVVLGEDRQGLADGAARAGRTVLHAELVPALDLLALADRPVAAFAGIGRPAKFFAMLERAGLSVVDRTPFADHHRYGADTIMRLAESAAAKGARLLTTEKDFVRLPPEARPLVIAVPVAVAWRDEAAIDAQISRLPQG